MDTKMLPHTPAVLQMEAGAGSLFKKEQKLGIL